MTQAPKRRRWATIVALIAVVVALVFNLNWVFGLLLLSWVVLDLVHGRAFLVEEVRRDEHPVLFALITLLWLVLAVFALFGFA